MSSLTHLLPPSPQPPTTTSRLLTPTTLPIPLLKSTLAKRYSYAHTLLVPLYYYLRTSALVSDPFPTMLLDLGIIAPLQALFCAVCLPSAGGWLSGTPGGPIVEGTAAAARSPKVAKSAGGTGSMRRKLGPNASAKGGASAKSSAAADGAGGSWRARVMPTFLSLILALTLPPFPLTLVALVLGAPLYPTSLLPSTLLLSLHVSLLGFFPLFYAHGVSSSAWRDVAAAWLPFDESGVWAATVGCILGGWIGAVPMALDWDREWQKWPCTVLWGVVMGWVFGRVLTNGLKLGVGARINLSEKEEEEEEVAEELESQSMDVKTVGKTKNEKKSA